MRDRRSNMPSGLPNATRLRSWTARQQSQVLHGATTVRADIESMTRQPTDPTAPALRISRSTSRRQRTAIQPKR